MGKNQNAPSKRNVDDVNESAQPSSNAGDSRPSLHTKSLRAEAIREIASKVVSISSGIPQRTTPAGKVSQKGNVSTSDLDKQEKDSVKVDEEQKKDELLPQSLSTLCLALSEDLKAAAALPEVKQHEALKKIRNVLEEFTTQANSLEPPPLPEPDQSGKTYRLYRPGTDPYKHLEDVWGPWLKHFTDELQRDYLYQDQLRRRDSLLFDTLYAKRKGIKRDHEIEFRVLLKPIKERKNAELAETSDVEMRRMARLSRLSYNR